MKTRTVVTGPSGLITQQDEPQKNLSYVFADDLSIPNVFYNEF